MALELSRRQAGPRTAPSSTVTAKAKCVRADSACVNAWLMRQGHAPDSLGTYSKGAYAGDQQAA